jgi:putative SOS response-associated peptidase YedK
MCGRYRLSRKKQIIEEYFESSPWDEDWSPRYNIAPTQAVPVVRQNPGTSPADFADELGSYSELGTRCFDC